MLARTDWKRVDNRRGILALAREWSSIAVVIAGALAIDSIIAYIFAVVLLGALQHRLAALGHEAAHGTLFSNRFWNEVAADLLCFFPVFGTLANYRRWHLAHHAAPNDPLHDPDILNLGPSLLRDQFPIPKRSFLWWVFLRWLSAPRAFVSYGWGYIKLNTFGRGQGLRARVRHHPRYPPPIANAARALYYLCVAAALAAGGLAGMRLFAIFWLAPLMSTFPYFLMLRDTFQHTNADMGRFTNTRVFRVQPILRWAVFPYGQDLHVPHHASPAVPHYRLEALHRHLLAHVPDYRPAVVECRGILWNTTGEPTVADVLTNAAL